MDRSQDNAEKVAVECLVPCAVPSLGIIAEFSEIRHVTPKVAERLVGMGRFRYVEQYVPASKPVVEQVPVAESIPMEKPVVSTELADIVGEKYIEALAAMGILTKEDLLNANKNTVSDKLLGVGPATVNKWLKAAKE